jgi:anthranilate synthase component 1
MQQYTFKSSIKKILADMLTPVSIYLRLRQEFKNTILLESSDYHGDEHNYSYICFDAIAGFKVENNIFYATFPDHQKQEIKLNKENANLESSINQFLKQFNNYQNTILQNCITNGLFGYMTYDVIEHFEDIKLKHQNEVLPTAQYFIYQYIIAFNHFNQELYIIKNDIENCTLKNNFSLDEIENKIKNNNIELSTFSSLSEKISNVSNEEYLEMVHKGKEHCYRGDVFQIVLSRQFNKKFEGDDFNLYRALRSINPSPYCFYFDFEMYKLIGSSPEAQLIIKDNKVTIHPIAGTFKRTGNDEKDAALAQQLSKDEKENAEHIMLVDLARNDLSRNGHDTTVEVYKEVQFYSHVIHLVSKVSSYIDNGTNKIKMFGDTFPAGTLSGAPKYRAMQLIDDIENTARNFYGGAIGWLNFNGDFNHAIMIRTFLSKNNQLTFQAGAGIVSDSVPESELQEVENKLNALNNAIEFANKI